LMGASPMTATLSAKSAELTDQSTDVAPAADADNGTPTTRADEGDVVTRKNTTSTRSTNVPTPQATPEPGVEVKAATYLTEDDREAIADGIFARMAEAEKNKVMPETRPYLGV